MLSEFNHFILKEKLFSSDDRILLAVSGGMDSVVMAGLFHRAGYSFGIAHCNFRLRGVESDADEEFVRKLAAEFRVDFHVERFQTEEFAARRKISIQMAARELRYDWFEKVRVEKGYGYIATAHHQDDEVETFLINLSRGTGLAGLHGILPKKGWIIRPMLFTSREAIEKFVKKENISYKEDSSNQETYYLRNRMRHIIIPELEKSFPGFRQNILQTMDNIRSAEQVYQSVIEEKSAHLFHGDEEQIRIDKAGIKALNPIHTWLFELLRPYGFHADVCEKIASSLDNEPGRFFFSDTHRLLVDREELIIVSVEKGERDEVRVFIDQDQGHIDHPVKMEWKTLNKLPDTIPDNKKIAYLDLSVLQFPLEIRKWKQGDYLFPLGMQGKKKLSDYFIDEKLNRLDKESSWLLCSGGEVAWIVGRRVDDRFKVTASTEKVMKVQLVD